MPKKCDHRSVGMLVFRDKKLLLIERAKFPYGFAAPAGHLDKDSSYEIAAKRELLEEVGMTTNSIELLIEGRKENQCRRIDGTWHYWKIYKIESESEINRSRIETKQAKFFSNDEIVKLASKTKRYLSGKISESDWEKSPGLEPIWLEWLSELKII